MIYEDNFYTDAKIIGGLEIKISTQNPHFKLSQIKTFLTHYINREFYTVTTIDEENHMMNSKVIFKPEWDGLPKFVSNITNEVGDIIRRQLKDIDPNFNIRKIPYKELHN